jgi:hypothetical protein
MLKIVNKVGNQAAGTHVARQVVGPTTASATNPRRLWNSRQILAEAGP